MVGCRVPGLCRFLTRGKAARQVEMLTAITTDARNPQVHPIRRIKRMVDRALAQLSPTFARMYAQQGQSFDTAGAPAQSRPADGAIPYPAFESAVSTSSAKGWNSTCCSSGFWT